VSGVEVAAAVDGGKVLLERIGARGGADGGELWSAGVGVGAQGGDGRGGGAKGGGPASDSGDARGAAL